MNKAVCFSVAILLSQTSWGMSMCPDGSYVDRGPCKICPDGSYIGAGARCSLAPDGNYTQQRSDNQPRITPKGGYISGDGPQKMCPDGSYVSGSRCKLTPNGTYIGVD